MTQITFYFNAADKLRAACLLSHKAIQNGIRVLLHTPDEAMLNSLDKMLWHYPATAFMPHGRHDAADAHALPVLLAHQDAPFPHSELLISLHTTPLPFFDRFERVIEIVGMDEQDKLAGRERFGFYREHGYALRHFNLMNQ